MTHGTHTVVLTRCWEFHVVDEICVAARDRSTGGPVAFHEAQGGRVLGSAVFNGDDDSWRLSTSMRLGEHLTIDGTRGRFHSAPILSLETHSRAHGYGLIARMQSTQAQPIATSRSAHERLRDCWARLLGPAAMKSGGATA